jgi:two-component system LytT family response regulator
MCAPVATCQIILTDSKGEHLFSSGNIIRMEAADNYTIVHFSNRPRPFIISKVLKVYEKLLSPYGFVRTHRSHLVNKQFVNRVENCNVVMQDASVARITQRKKNVCKKKLK